MGSISTGQSKPKDTSTETKSSKPPEKVVLVGMQEEQSWDDFVNTCLKLLKEAGLLQENQQPPSCGKGTVTEKDEQ